ncbi:hypothetical protein MMC07_002844 [Pseudocyphellaria aurata]|nr:hypothetical protein [Pseudocyphellaria aurata]
MAANLSRFERELDRIWKGRKWKEGQQIVINSIDSRVAQAKRSLTGEDSQEPSNDNGPIFRRGDRFQLPFFCNSSAAAPLLPSSVKLNVTETLVAANEGLTRVVNHVAVMHAFPELLFGLQWTMTNFSGEMRAASHSAETRQGLLIEFRGYRSASSAVYSAIKLLYSGIYDDVGLVLTFTYNTIDQLQARSNLNRYRAQKTAPNILTRYWQRLAQRRRSVLSAIGTKIPLSVETHLARLLPKMKNNIRAGDRLLDDFQALLHHFDAIRTTFHTDDHRWKAAHSPKPKSNANLPSLFRWLHGGPAAAPQDVSLTPDEKLAQFRPLIVQGQQSIQHLLAQYRDVHADLSHLAENLRGDQSWADDLSPRLLMHDLRRGVKALTGATEDWIQLLIDDYMFLRLTPTADRELNPLTRRIEAEAARRKTQREGNGGDEAKW